MSKIDYETITNYGEDEYTLMETLEELELPMDLMEDDEVIKAFEKGKITPFIDLMARGEEIESFLEIHGITLKKCEDWKDTYKEEIEAAKEKIKKESLSAAQQISDPLAMGVLGILYQTDENKRNTADHKTIAINITDIVKDIKKGNTNSLLTALTSQLLQMQNLNILIAMNITGQAGKQLDNFQSLSSLSIKVNGEMRKTAMALNEIVNPKRTTFVKEATQNNFIQNSEKKVENENEKQIASPDKIIEEVEIIEEKEKIK